MDTVFLSLKQYESLGNNQNSAFLTPIKPENFYQVLWGAFLCGHMENAIFLGENAWFLKCMQKTTRNWVSWQALVDRGWVDNVWCLDGMWWESCFPGGKRMVFKMYAKNPHESLGFLTSTLRRFELLMICPPASLMHFVQIISNTIWWPSQKLSSTASDS